jgi:hypothetical protein
LRGKIGDTLAGDDEFAALAIDMAQHGLGGGNAVQADLALGEMHIHGPFSFQSSKGEAPRHIDQS